MNNIYKFALVTWLVFTVCLLFYGRSYAYDFLAPSGDPLKEPVVIRTTCYVANDNSVCSTGVKPHTGVVAGCKAWEGMAVALYTFEYDEDGKPIPKECIGLYTVLDTGAGIDTNGDGQGDSLRDGKSIDVYCNTLHEAEEFRDKYGDYTLMYLISEGD